MSDALTGCTQTCEVGPMVAGQVMIRLEEGEWSGYVKVAGR